MGCPGWRLPLSVAAGLVIAPLGGAARAAPEVQVALEYEMAPDAGGGCPDAEEFQASVQRQLGYDPFRSISDRRVAVQIARKEAGFDGRIRWSDAGGRWVGERQLSSRRPECGAIAASLAFAVAVQIQLLATLAPEVPERAAPPTLPAAPPPAARAPDAGAIAVEQRGAAAGPPAPPPGPPATRLALSVGLGPSLALGVGPGPTGLGRIFVSSRRGRLSLELAADAALRTTQHQADGSGFSLDRFAAGAAACGHVRALAACLTATVGRLEARGLGVDAPASPVGWFSQAGARIVATRDLGDRYFAAARVDGLVMLRSWDVTLNDAVAWTTPRVGALIGLDFGARF